MSEIPKNEPIAQPNLINDLRMIFQTVVKGVEAFRKRFEEIGEIVGPALVNLKHNLQKLPERTKAIQHILAARGWYVLPQMPLTFYLLEPQTVKDAPNVDDVIGQFIEEHIDETEADLILEFPNRAAILREAFACHREEKYAASITVLLTQADGIVIDLLGKPFFSKERDSSDPQTRKVIEELQLDVYRKMMLEPLITRGGMSANRQELDQYPESLHRHQILHGIDLTYPTKLNSLKVISLVGYLGGLAKEIIADAAAKQRDVEIGTGSGQANV